MLDESLPLTPPEWPEWGNPIKSKRDFQTIRSYSPYENVAAKAYPHIFAYAGLTDPRVTYWEPAKWIARLRHLNTSPNLILLKTNMEAGHGGASGRFEALKEMAVDYAFALKIAGQAGVGRGVSPRHDASFYERRNRRGSDPASDLDLVAAAAGIEAGIVAVILVVGGIVAGIVVLVVDVPGILCARAAAAPAS
jgi:hypothetical protein